MIRLFLLAAGFLSVTIALLASQLGGSDDTAFNGSGDISAEITRADNSLFGQPAAPRTIQTRTVAEAQNQSTQPSTALGGSDIDMMTRSILTELRRPVTGDRLRRAASNTATSTDTATQNDGLRALTDGVLAGLGTTPAPAPTPAPTTQTTANAATPQSLKALIITAMREGKSDAYVDQLINEAVGKGQVTAPAAIVTSSGEVDTATLLDSLVQQSLSGQSAPAAAPVPAASIAQDIAPEGDLFYTVQPGDSLAGIALRHFGTTTAHDIIFLANRDQLPSPSAVRPGMRLRIPEI